MIEVHDWYPMEILLFKQYLNLPLIEYLFSIFHFIEEDPETFPSAQFDLINWLVIAIIPILKIFVIAQLLAGQRIVHLSDRHHQKIRVAG
jgi:hypothetical protein